MTNPVWNSYPRETNVIEPVTVEVDGEPVTAGVELAVCKDRARPTSWVAAVVIDSATIGVRIQNLTPGLYTVFARVTTELEQPVIELDGKFYIT